MHQIDKIDRRILNILQADGRITNLELADRIGLSPTLNLVTLEPTAVTMPTISWPGTIGKAELPHSLRAWWMSEWQTPQYLISITTSSSRGSRRSKVKGVSGFDASVAAYPLAMAISLSSFWERVQVRREPGLTHLELWGRRHGER